MSNPESATEEKAYAIYAYAAEQMGKGVSPADVEKDLIGQGLEPEGAALVVRKLREIHKEAARKNKIHGALWCIGGLTVSVVTWLLAGAGLMGGSYVVAWGAVVYGAILYLRGVHASDE